MRPIGVGRHVKCNGDSSPGHRRVLRARRNAQSSPRFPGDSDERPDHGRKGALTRDSYASLLRQIYVSEALQPGLAEDVQYARAQKLESGMSSGKWVLRLETE